MEVEFTLLSDRRQGLLRELGNIIIQCGFSLLRHRVSAVERGAELWFRVSGREDALLELEERLGSHPLVLSFESEHLVNAESPAGALSAKSPLSTSPFKSGGQRPPGTGPVTELVEAELPRLARDYPRIFPRLVGLAGRLPRERKAPSLEFAGRRVGVWVYKRDYALGGKLDLHGALKEIALPAMRNLLPADLKGDSVRVKNSPLCAPGHRGRNGDFFCGFLRGLLEEAGVPGSITVREVFCRGDGAEECVFEISD